jgi:hypothetical protein
LRLSGASVIPEVGLLAFGLELGYLTFNCSVVKDAPRAYRGAAEYFPAQCSSQA